MTNFGIPTTEYEQERHVFEMCRWINEKLSEMEKEQSFDTIYFERKGTNVKKFIEEAMPVAGLALYLYRPPDDVVIQCLAGNQPFDARLSVKPFRNFSMKVEVTTVETQDSVMRRQALSRHGFTYGTGPIQRLGRSIVSKPMLVDVENQEQEWIDLAFSRVLAKLKNRHYGRDTALVVSLDTWRPMSLESRANLAHRTWLHIIQEDPDIQGVYFFHAREFIVDGITKTYK
jgi:hypothetical protein